MKIINIFRRRIAGWILYSLLILGLVLTFGQIITTKETPVNYFNTDMIIYEVDGKTHYKYKTDIPQPIIKLDIIDFDVLKKKYTQLQD